MTPEAATQQMSNWWLLQYSLAGVLAGVSIEGLRRLLDRPRLSVRIKRIMRLQDKKRGELLELVVENRGHSGTMLERSIELSAQYSEPLSGRTGGRVERHLRIEETDTELPPHSRRALSARSAYSDWQALFIRRYTFRYSGSFFPARLYTLGFEADTVSAWQWWRARVFFARNGRFLLPGRDKDGVSFSDIDEAERQREFGERR